MWLVTGASGFLGRALVAALARHANVGPARVIVLVRCKAQWQRSMVGTPQAACPVIEGTLADVPQWEALARHHGVTGVFHLAATVRHSRLADDIAETWRVNVEGTRAVALLCARLSARCVFVSSSGTVGCHPHPGARPNEQASFAHDTVSRWPYYRSKIAAETAARELLPSSDQLVIIRPPVLLGPGDTLYRSTGTVVRFLRGRVPFSLAGGIAFIDVRDTVGPLLAAMQRHAPAPIYHLPGHAMSLQHYFGHLARLSGRKPPVFVLPRPLAMGLAYSARAWARLRGQTHAALEPVTVEMGHYFWDISTLHAAEHLGYHSRPADHTLADTIDDLCRRRRDCEPAPGASAA